MLINRLRIAAKALLQLGPEPLVLYAVYKVGLRTGHYRRTEARELKAAAPADRFNEYLPLPQPRQLLETLGKDGKAAVLRSANEVLQGRVRLFGDARTRLQLGFKQSLHHWTDYETHKAALPILQSSDSAAMDPKFLWEPGRFGWAFSLGRAYHLTANEKYAVAFWKYFGIFDRGNPAYLGPHWMSGQEVAIRLMALVWCESVFGLAPASTPKRKARLRRSVWQHAARIPLTLIYARSQNNNHLVTEAAALYAAGAVLDHRPWRELGWHWLNDALQRQIGTYGEYIQHSTNYHRLMLQAALFADAIRRSRGETWPAATVEALKRASHWLFSMLDPHSGRTPNLGANDGAMILPLASSPFDDYRPTVQAAARAFLRTSLPPGPWDESSLWLGLTPSAHTADPAAYAAEHLRGRHSWAYLRASSFKSRLSHMDQLHFDLWWRGINITQDVGTYVYNAAPPWDNSLVSSRVHSTVTVDGREQMTRGGRFLTLDWFPAYSKNLLTNEDRVLGSMLAYHNGYQRLGIRHERQASVFDDDHWEIRDDLLFSKPGEHLFRLHWLLPDWKWRILHLNGTAAIELRSPRGWMRLLTQTEPAVLIGESSLSLVRAGRVVYGRRMALPFEGWISPTYGRKLPALSLAVEASADRSFSFASKFIFPD